MKGGASSHLISQVNKKLGEQEPEISSKLLNMKVVIRIVIYLISSCKEHRIIKQRFRFTSLHSRNNQVEKESPRLQNLIILLMVLKRKVDSHRTISSTKYRYLFIFLTLLQFKDRRGQVSDSDTESEDEDPQSIFKIAM